MQYSSMQYSSGAGLAGSGSGSAASAGRLQRLVDQFCAPCRFELPRVSAADASRCGAARVCRLTRGGDAPLPAGGCVSVSLNQCEGVKQPAGVRGDQYMIGRPVPPDVEIFDMQSQSIRDFDRTEFLREGRWLWSGVMLPWVRRSWTAALQRVQTVQDEMILQDWTSHGWDQPPPDVKQRMLGGSGSTGRPSFDLFKPPAEANRPRHKPTLPFGTGSWPEHFAAGSDPFLMSILTHPQMLALHRMMLGDEIRFDHNTLLNRVPGFQGQRYHSHPYVEDNAGPTTRPGGARLLLARTLCYPEGFAATNDAGLKIVPGSHLFRENGGHGDLWNIGEAKEKRELDPSKADSVLRAGWLQGKRNTITGAKLKIERPALPPGSMASILHHTLHGVDPKDPSAETRWCCLMAYRAPDPRKCAPTESRNLPPMWERDQVAQLDGELAAMVRAAAPLFDRY